MSQKPNVLIFGALNGLAPALLLHLIPPRPAEPLVGHIRMVDKYSIHPPTTYVGKDFLQVIKDRSDLVEYHQANLTIPSVVSDCFNRPSPNGAPYTHVLDLSGNLSHTVPSGIQIAQTFNISLLLAREALRRGVKCFVRLQGPWYEHLDLKDVYTEDDQRGWKAWGGRGVWWHEALRAIGSLEGLPLVVLRCGYPYGNGMVGSEAITAILFGLVYKKLGTVLKVEWVPELRKNTIHSTDLAAALWKSAEWMASIDRATANSIAGVPLPPTGDPEVSTVPDAIQTGNVLVPVFNVVDDGDTNQVSMIGEITKVFGTNLGQVQDFQADLSTMDFQEIVEELNDLHCGTWAEIITTSNPPVPDTPLSPYLQAYQLLSHGCAMNGDKIRKVLSFKPAYPRFEVASIKAYIEWCRQQGIWPNSSIYTN